MRNKSVYSTKDKALYFPYGTLDLWTMAEGGARMTPEPMPDPVPEPRGEPQIGLSSFT